MLSFLKILIVLLFISHSLGQVVIPPEYNKSFRPPGKSGKALEASFSMKINGIKEIDTSKMSVKLHMYMRVSWVDERLLFPEEYMNHSTTEDGGLSVSTSLLSKIWTPDHFFRHTKSIKTFRLLQDFQGMKLTKDKRIYTSSMIEIEIGCPMSFRNFPFDTQRCRFEMGSYFYNIYEIKFTWQKLGLTLDDDISTQLADYDYQLVVSNETVCDCLGCFPDKTPCLQIMLILRRRYFAHVLSYFIPSSLFVMVSWTSFFWPPHVIPGRTVLVITSLLTVSSLFSSSRQAFPNTSYVKAIDAWMFFTIITAVLTLFQYAVVLQWLRLKDVARETKIKPVGKAQQEQDELIQKYLTYQHRTELVGRVGVLLLFVIFNLGYWPFFF